MCVNFWFHFYIVNPKVSNSYPINNSNDKSKEEMWLVELLTMSLVYGRCVSSNLWVHDIEMEPKIDAHQNVAGSGVVCFTS